MAVVHQLFELADLQKNVPAEGRVPWHPQLHRLPGVLVLLSIIDTSGELGITVAISDAPAQSTPVFYLPTKAGEPHLLRHVRRKNSYAQNHAQKWADMGLPR